MKKSLQTVCVLSAVLFLTGYGGSSFEPSASSLYIQKDGSITEAIVESFAQEYYSFDEFESMVEKEVETYNQGFDEEQVSIQSVELKNSAIYLLLDYPDAEAYSAYNELYCFQGTVAEALAEGLTFDMVFRDVDYEEYDTVEVTAKSSNKVLVLRDECVVQTESAIKYVSNNVEILSSHMAEVMPIDDEEEYAYIIY
ncbi:MAG: hypothetical protein LUE24_05660 [Lachnospiraceae bacterium]|nr:hypothetical protein [Lachnospiraceae bacterium]